MKKTLITLACIITILCLNKEETITIPNESIRFRVIANSNSILDQNIKKKVVNNIKSDISNIIKESNDIEQTRYRINKKLPEFNQIVENSLSNTCYKDKYKVNYGMNYFPQKTYKGVTIESGEYESLVVTIGDGLGDNFWCILFPPLCQIDEDVTNIEYKSLVKEILNKYI